MPFDDYCKTRFLRLATAMEKDGSPIFDDITKNRQGKLRLKRGKPTGNFTKIYIELKNSNFSSKYPKNIIKVTKKLNFRQLLIENAQK